MNILVANAGSTSFKYPLFFTGDGAGAGNTGPTGPSEGSASSKAAAAGFKTVHAGRYRGAVILTRDVLRAMGEHLTVAPAHNRHYIDVISLFTEKYPGLPLVGLFEPQFHDSLPAEARARPDAATSTPSCSPF